MRKSRWRDKNKQEGWKDRCRPPFQASSLPEILITPSLLQPLPVPLLETVQFLTSSRAACRLRRLQKPPHCLESDQLLQRLHHTFLLGHLPNWLPVVCSFKRCSIQFSLPSVFPSSLKFCVNPTISFKNFTINIEKLQVFSRFKYFVQKIGTNLATILV